MKATVAGLMWVAAVSNVLAGAAAPGESAPAVSANGGRVFAALDAPKSGDWLNADRWKDEQLDGKAAVRLIARTGYARVKVAAELPKDGPVMLRAQYYSSGTKAFAAGIGEYGSPTELGAVRPKGWQTEELILSANVIAGFLKDGKISVLIQGEGTEGPAFARIELLAPTREQVLTRFRKWVRDATDDAWAASKTKDFTGVPTQEGPAPEPTAEESARGAVPILRSYLSFIYPESVPTKDERTLQGRVNMTPGEYEPIQFAVLALKDMDQLTVEAVGAPKGLDVDVRWVECVPVRTGGGTGGGGTGGGTGGTQPTMLVASAEFEPSEIQDLADLVPQLLDFKAKAKVPLRFHVRLEVGDGTQKPSPMAAAELNKLLDGLKDGFQAQ